MEQQHKNVKYYETFGILLTAVFLSQSSKLKIASVIVGQNIFSVTANLCGHQMFNCFAAVHHNPKMHDTPLLRSALLVMICITRSASPAPLPSAKFDLCQTALMFRHYNHTDWLLSG